MAKNEKVKKKVKYTLIHKFSVGVSLLSFVVVMLAGIMSDVRVITMTYRAFVVFLAIMVITRVLVRAWASFEETKRG